MTNERLLDKKEVCWKLKISPATLDRLVRSGKLEKLKFGTAVRFRPADIEEYLGGEQVDENI